MGAKVRPENFKGNKNSGRKTIAEELKGAIDNITAEALIKLATNKVFKQLNQDIDFNQTKEMALPVALKGITERSEVDVNVQQIIIKRADANQDDPIIPPTGQGDILSSEVQGDSSGTSGSQDNIGSDLDKDSV